MYLLSDIGAYFFDLVCIVVCLNLSMQKLSLYRVQPVAAGCVIGWDAAMPLMQCPPYQYTGTHFADLGRMTG